MIFFQQHDFVRHFRRKYQHLKLPPVPDVEIPHRKISFCTTCMNRLHDLKETLPRNIEDNKDYGPLEFVLLDYSSSDGLGDWVRTSMMSYIESGILNYYRLDGEPHFKPNHSRNVSFRVATGEIVVNIDADNVAHRGFARRVNQCAHNHTERLLIVPDSFLRPDSKRLLLRGRYGLFKDDILALGGMDQRLDCGFGSDDVNFLFRAIRAGYRLALFEARYVEDRIETSDEDRIRLINTSGLDFQESKARNESITADMLACGETIANVGTEWGKAELVKNFKERTET